MNELRARTFGVSLDAHEARREQALQNLLNVLTCDRTNAGEVGRGLRTMANQSAQHSTLSDRSPIGPVRLLCNPAQPVKQGDRLVDDGAKLAVVVLLAEPSGAGTHARDSLAVARPSRAPCARCAGLPATWSGSLG
jgi:hypothetical protein